MRKGKTRRDHETGAWINHVHNHELRRLENSGHGYGGDTAAPTLRR